MKGRVQGFKYDARTKTARFEVIVPDTKGRVRQRKKVSATTRAEALQLWSAFRKKVLAGKKEPDTFAGYVERYWPLLAARLSTRSRPKEESRIHRVLMPFFGDVRLPRINAALVKDFVSHLKQNGYKVTPKGGTEARRPYSPAAINDALSVLRKILRDAVDREEIDSYPIHGRLPREKEPILRLEMTPDEERRFLAAFDDEASFRALIELERNCARVARIETGERGGASTTRLHGGGRKPDGTAVGYHFQRFRESKRIFVVALETGLRKGDLLALRWSQVDLINGWIRLVMQKTGIEATIPITPECRAALLECRDRSVVGEKVFLNDHGRPFPEVSVKRYFGIAKQISGITRRLRFHDLRHTFASTLASNGVGPHVIAKALGHTSTRMTDRYARPSPEAMRSIVAALERAKMNSSVNSVQLVAAAASGTSTSEMNGLPARIRTGDPRLRRPMLLSS